MRFLLILMVSLLIIYGCNAEKLEFQSPKLVEFGETALLKCVNNLSAVSDLLNADWTAKWKVTDGNDTSLINFEKKDAATEEYKNSPDQFKGRFESKTIVTEDGVEMVATLANVTASDELSYKCEFETGEGSEMFSYTGQGSFRAFNRPEVAVNNVSNPLELETVELDNGTVVMEPATNEVLVTTCTITNAYPKPMAISWFSIDDATRGGVESAIEGDFMGRAKFAQNADESWNVTSAISLAPDLSLHLKRLQCRVDLGYGYKSVESGSLLVNHPTTDVKLSVSRKNVKEGRLLQVSCETDGYPLNDHINLYKIANGEEVLISATETEHEQVVLFEKKAHRSDSGTYVCRVGGIEKAARVNVQYYDDQVVMKASTTDELTVGDSIEIFCTHNSHPPLTVMMKRPGGEWLATEKLVVLHGQAKDSGKYQCKTSSRKVQMSTMDVQFTDSCRPQMQTNLTESSEGDFLVTVSCTTERANPACDILIESSDDLRVNGHSKRQNSLTKQFIVGSNEMSTTPTFLCHASNMLGRNVTGIRGPNLPTEGGLSTLMIVVIISAVTFLLVGLPLVYYKFCKKPANESHIKGKQLDAAEVEKL